MGRDSVVEQLGRLYDLTRKLREECPWDRKQTQESIIAYTIEETYELADTIAQRAEHGDAAVRGELGDLLFQVYFLACVAEEHGLDADRRLGYVFQIEVIEIGQFHGAQAFLSWVAAASAGG